MAEAQRPDYLYSGGNVLMHPPLMLDSSEQYGFFVKGRRSALQRTVDETLNAAAGGRMQFKVLSPYVLLTFTDVRKAYSGDPVDRAKGWGQETDVVTWVMVGQILPGETKVNHIYFYPCHIWVNDCMALINGRELYGYPKYECLATMPTLLRAEGDALGFTVSCKGFEPFSPDSRLAMHPLLEVTPQSPLPPPTPLQDFEALVRQAVAVLASDADALDLTLAGWEQVIRTFLSPGMDQVFLKQFPSGDGVKAVYQAVVTAPAKIDKITAVNLLNGPFACNVHRFASFPLDRTLGWALGAQPAVLPFHVSMDFSVTPAVELVDNSVVRPQKVAIIGGGVGAMTAAFYLTESPGWHSRYDITVYQMGWRIGGKGASGRNAEAGQRIEEHGLHIWFGFYENAFALMRRAYELLDRPPGAPLATWDQAFKPQHFFALMENVRNEWLVWPIDTPDKPGVPGDGGERISLWDVVVTACCWIEQWLHELHSAHEAAPPLTAGHGNWLQRLAELGEQGVEHLAADVGAAAKALHAFVCRLGSDLQAHEAAQHALVHANLQCLRNWLKEAWPTPGELATELRRLYICADLAICSLIGMFEDHVLTEGFEVINDIDFRAWLTKHGANVDVSVDSAPVRGLYDLCFAFEDGDYARPNMEAGTMLHGTLLMVFGYRGSIMWKMQAGMGDVVFTPFYQLLRQRGVTFKFFHQVEELLPAADDNTVEKIVLTRQVDVTRGADHYEPLVDVKGLACWPSTPQYGQIVPAQAELLQAKNINLESFWSDWPEVYAAAFGRPLPQVVLQRGRDFDLVIFGASAASVPVLAPRLVERSPALQAMNAAVKTVATQAYQVWLTKDLAGLGWTTQARDPEHANEEPVLTSFSEPYDTWASMEQLIAREAWPPGFEPKNISYFCSALPMASYPPRSDHAFPAECKAIARAGAVNQLDTEIGALWPEAVTRAGFRWDWLVDEDGGTGQARFASQYWRANVDPSERYVLSVVGSSRHRVSTDGTGFANLYVTGDWIRTGMNAGCVEAATMAGMQTARAICGWPRVIRGESGW